MTRKDSDTAADATGALGDWSRRTVLKLTGGGVALGGFASGGVLAQEDGDDGENGDGDGADGGQGGGEQEASDDSALFDDLVDPVWGYPLDADETAVVDVQNAVEMVSVGGAGEHEGFPVDPETGESPPVEFYFDPVGVHLEPGAVVQFVTTAGEHTATAFHEKYDNPELTVPNRIPDGVPGFTAPPVTAGESWVYNFETPGVYDVLCLPHLFAGMVMRAVVFDPDTHDVEDERFAAPSSDGLNPNVQAVYDAPELDPATILERGAVAWADLTLGGE